MSDRYRVCIIMPPGYAHSGCFVEVAHLLVASFTSLGIDCDVKLNELAQDRTNVLLGFHLLKYGDLLRQARYIPYQLEQLSETEGAWSENVRAVLAGATQVWDYSQENVAFLQDRGIAARLLPVGYHPALEIIPASTVKDHDVLFFGSIGPRRKAVLDRIAAIPDLRTKIVFGAYGKARDELVSRSKVILNIHYYSTRIFEAVRISYLLNNRCFVLTEDSPINPYQGVEIATASYNNLAERCMYYAREEGEREQLRQRAYEQFRDRYPMTRLLAQALALS